MAVESFRIEGLDGVAKTLRELPPEIVSKHGGPVRKALRKASKVLVDEAKANIQKIVDEPNIDGQFVSTGLLKNNIITTRNNKMRDRGERYVVRIRTKKYPKKSPNEKTVTTVQVGRILEAGTEKLNPPKPWLRPAFDAKKTLVVPMFVTELNKNLTRIVNKLAKQNGVA